MLPAFNMLAASVIALAWLAIALLFPILAVWFGVRVARDLRRIADAAESLAPREAPLLPEQRHVYAGVPMNQRARVANSMFGR